MRKTFLLGIEQPLIRFLWAAVLVTLPVTSFRYFPGLGETTYVRPLAFYPLALLLPILFIQLIRKKIPFPWSGSLIVFGAFLLVLFGTSMFGALQSPLEMRGQIYWGRAIRAWVTILIGFSFFLSAIWMNRNEKDLKFSLQWLGVGFVITMLWSGLQAVTFHTPLLEKETVTHWQLAFSMRELVKTNRISGLAYEPAWLAGQIATLYLPWLFSAVLTKTHLTRVKWLEATLFGLGTLLLLSTYSRGGLFTGLISGALTFLLVGRQKIQNSWQWFLSGFFYNEPTIQKRVFAIGKRLSVVLLIFLVVIGSFALLNQKNYFARLWNTRAEDLSEFIIENSAGARVAYAWGALSVFNQHSWIGVGLGASGFYLYDFLPDWALTTVPEIARQLSPANHLFPNPKNMYLRILVEAGLVGFSLYLAFWAGLLGDTLVLLRKPGLMRFVGIAGLNAWLAIGLYNVTQDSFATPNIWINLGMVVGMANFAILNELSVEGEA